MAKEKDIRDVRLSESRRGRPKKATNAEIQQLREQVNELYKGSLQDLMEYMRKLGIEPRSKSWNAAISAWKTPPPDS